MRIKSVVFRPKYRARIGRQSGVIDEMRCELGVTSLDGIRDLTGGSILDCLTA